MGDNLELFCKHCFLHLLYNNRIQHTDSTVQQSTIQCRQYVLYGKVQCSSSNIVLRFSSLTSQQLVRLACQTTISVCFAYTMCEKGPLCAKSRFCLCSTMLNYTPCASWCNLIRLTSCFCCRKTSVQSTTVHG